MCAFILLKFLELPCTSRIGEAVARGILPAPKYVLSIYSYRKELEKYQTRIRHSKNRAVQVVIIGTKNNISSPVFRIVVEFFRHHILLLPIHCTISSILTNHIHGWHMPRKYLAKTVRSATNIRYLDNQRDMAWELFGGNIASELTLGEAVARGILPAPKYVLARRILPPPSASVLRR